MIQTGHGRPRRALALGALLLSLLLSLVLAPAPAGAAKAPYGNVVQVDVRRPAGDEVVLTRVRVHMALRRGVAPRPLGRLNVRRVGAGLPRGFAIAGVRARPRGGLVTVRLAAVRTGRAARARGPLRVRLKIGGRHVVFSRASTWRVAIAPGVRPQREPGCAAMGGEAQRWTAVAGLRAIALGGERFGARTAVGAAQARACRRRLASVPADAAQRFLTAVDGRLGGGPRGPVEAFYATWAKHPDGTAKVCVYVRGGRGATGDVTVGSAWQPFTLDDDTGIAKTVTEVPGDGEYAFKVRWRQPDNTYDQSAGLIRVPPGNPPGESPPAPYSAAGPCA